VPAAGPVPELRGGAGIFDHLAATAVHRVRLRRGEGDDDQTVPLVRVVDRNGHDFGESPGVLVNVFWGAFWCAVVGEVVTAAVVWWVMAIRSLL
jgi:hypothetical protein